MKTIGIVMTRLRNWEYIKNEHAQEPNYKVIEEGKFDIGLYAINCQIELFCREIIRCVGFTNKT